MDNGQIEKALAAASRSMEVEGFTIDSDIMEQGRKLLSGKETLDVLIARQIQAAKAANQAYGR